jgi:glycosyltransferase involved in cell wall biosynthesis
MKIAYLSTAKIPSRYANSIQVMKMCHSFASDGHQVTLFAIKQPLITAKTEDDFQKYGIEPNFEIIKCWRFMSDFYIPYQVKQMRSQFTLLYGRNAKILASIASLGIPMVFESHDSPRRLAEQKKEQDWVLRQYKIQDWLLKQENLKRLVVISDALRCEYLDIFPWFPDEKVVVAHDGADLPQPAKENYISWPGRGNCLQIGYVGHLYAGKGMEIITRLAEMLPDVDFHIIGGMDKDIQRWRQICIAPNLYFHGHIWQEHLQSYYKYFDIVLLPYRGEQQWNSPLKMFEYMAAKKAIIASDIPVLREVLVDRVNSLLVAPNDPEAWVAAIKKLAVNPELKNNLATQARKEVELFYTWQMRANKVLQGLTGK